MLLNNKNLLSNLSLEKECFLDQNKIAGHAKLHKHSPPNLVKDIVRQIYLEKKLEPEYAEDNPLMIRVNALLKSLSIKVSH